MIVALTLSLIVQAQLSPTPSLSRPSSQASSSPPERMLCAVTPQLKVAVLFGSDASGPATALSEDLTQWQCLSLFSLPVSIPMNGDAALPEGAARIADRIGVDWIITVSPQTSKEYVTARLIEVSNLTVVAAKTGSPREVSLALLGPVRDELQSSMDNGVRVNIVLEPATYAQMKALQNTMYGQPKFVDVGSPRLADRRGLIVVKYKGSVDALAAFLDGKDLSGAVVHVGDVKLRRIELRPSATP